MSSILRGLPIHTSTRRGRSSDTTARMRELLAEKIGAAFVIGPADGKPRRAKAVASSIWHRKSALADEVLALHVQSGGDPKTPKYDLFDLNVYQSDEDGTPNDSGDFVTVQRIR